MIVIGDTNKENRKEYTIEISRIGIKLADLIEKMTSTISGYDAVLELQKAANHLSLARTMMYYDDKIEEEIDKENE